MRFEFIILDVDGSLANPVVRIAVIVWSALLAAVTASVVLRSRRFQFERGSEPGTGKFSGVLACLLVFLYVGTPLGQSLIGSLIYRFRNPQVVSVGFFGQQLWIAPVIGLLAGLAALAIRRHKPVSVV